jgi:hypothetical protein
MPTHVATSAETPTTLPTIADSTVVLRGSALLEPPPHSGAPPVQHVSVSQLQLQSVSARIDRSCTRKSMPQSGDASDSWCSSTATVLAPSTSADAGTVSERTGAVAMSATLDAAAVVLLTAPAGMFTRATSTPLK